MERELLFTGIGGQGVQLACQVLARALTLEGRYVLSLGTYAGTMRGGSTDASLVYGSGPISSPPVVAHAWSGILMHHRFWQTTQEKLRPGSVVLLNTPVFEATEGLDGLRRYDLPALQIATDLGSAMGASMVMIGAYAALTGAVSLETLQEAMSQSLPSYRRQHLAANLALLAAGYARLPHLAEPAWLPGTATGEAA